MNRLRALAAIGVLASVRGLDAQEAQLHGYLDCRLVAAPAERSWTAGGLGKTRFGDDRELVTCAQAALDGSWQITPTLLAFADLQVATTGHDDVSLLEGYLRYRPVSTTPLRVSVKVGAFFPPISLENDVIGWTSPWTLTPSAINGWVGEELRAIGAEGRVEWRGSRYTVEGIGALLRSNDPAGELLAARGFAMSDLTSGLGTRVREPDIYALEGGESSPLRFNPFLENDGRLGWYAGGTWRATGIARISVLRYDNRADPSTMSRGVTPVLSWRTKFWSGGAELDWRDLVVLTQAMTGSTEIAPSPFFSTTTDFRAAFVLLGWNIDTWRAALRVDTFETDQLPRSIAGRIREHGTAATLALNWRPFEWLRLTGEVLTVWSTRNERADIGLDPRQIDHQLQLGARLLF